MGIEEPLGEPAMNHRQPINPSTHQPINPSHNIHIMQMCHAWAIRTSFWAQNGVHFSRIEFYRYVWQRIIKVYATAYFTNTDPLITIFFFTRLRFRLQQRTGALTKRQVMMNPVLDLLCAMLFVCYPRLLTSCLGIQSKKWKGVAPLEPKPSWHHHGIRIPIASWDHLGTIFSSSSSSSSSWSPWNNLGTNEREPRSNVKKKITTTL